MQLGGKSRSGTRVFLRNDKIIIANKKGIPRIVIGAVNKEDSGLRSGNPSTFNQLGRTKKEMKNG